MASTLAEMLARNLKFAATYQAPPGLQVVADTLKAGPSVIVLSCSDPRLNPYKIFGVDPSIKATMVRNAGGRAIDAVRTISVLQTIGGAKTIAVVHHTDCGMTHVNDEMVRSRLLAYAPEDKETIEKSKFGEIKGSIEESLKEDVALLAGSPFVSPGTNVVGLKLDISNGIVTEVNRAVNRA